VITFGEFMALKPKTASLRIRIDPELLERYRVICEKRDWTVSDGIRRHMQHVVGPIYRVAAESQEPQEASEVVESASSVSLPAEPAEDDSDKPEGPLARKRRLEKEAKALKMAKREERR